MDVLLDSCYRATEQPPIEDFEKAMVKTPNEVLADDSCVLWMNEQEGTYTFVMA